ncbi:transposase [Ralstonia pseudosolanacearum]|nr:transposase [Ralstonia pseudosolanacearum]MDC6286540.1 transposase [Ralstonia pseudosolanacearum]MDC6293503.1 transposase [Ralstonia pseudosolanacearum]MDD7791645.1 transposase [Ralstonia pseudosolanacearum]MDN3370423.1 transposase [Ralstonia pseudosolanacearum]MDO3515049.1 transposase [Ralstonia pseudosolanacearum]
MWKKEHREREAKLARKTKRYPSDMTDVEWAAVQPLLPRVAVRGRRRECDLREVANALRYLVRAGCGWRRDRFPPARGGTPTHPQESRERAGAMRSASTAGSSINGSIRCLELRLAIPTVGHPRQPVQPRVALGARQREDMLDGLRAVHQFALEASQTHLVGLRLDHLVDAASLQQRRAACGRRHRSVWGLPTLLRRGDPDGPGTCAVACPFGVGAVRVDGAIGFRRDAAGGDGLAHGCIGHAPMPRIGANRNSHLDLVGSFADSAWLLY